MVLKKALVKALVIVIVGLLIWMGYLTYQKLNLISVRNEQVINLPEFNSVTIDDEVLDISSQVKQKPIMLLFYSSDCPYCKEVFNSIAQYEIEEFVIIACSKQTPIQIHNFRSELGLDFRDDIKFIIDENLSFFSLYNVQSIPSYFVYNQDNELIYAQRGARKWEETKQAVLKALEN